MRGRANLPSPAVKKTLGENLFPTQSMLATRVGPLWVRCVMHSESGRPDDRVPLGCRMPGGAMLGFRLPRGGRGHGRGAQAETETRAPRSPLSKSDLLPSALGDTSVNPQRSPPNTIESSTSRPLHTRRHASVALRTIMVGGLGVEPLIRASPPAPSWEAPRTCHRWPQSPRVRTA